MVEADMVDADVVDADVVEADMVEADTRWQTNDDDPLQARFMPRPSSRVRGSGFGIT
jgi:hypothetical protein